MDLRIQGVEGSSAKVKSGFTAKAQRSQRTAFYFLVFNPAFLCVLGVSSEAPINRDKRAVIFV
jgi:hypothetical protein